MHGGCTGGRAAGTAEATQSATGGVPAETAVATFGRRHGGRIAADATVATVAGDAVAAAAA